MKVTPVDGGSVATWHHTEVDIAVGAVWTEKKKGRGEDAPPTWLHHRGSGRGVIAVYDGAGGAGARSVGRTPDDQEVSGAFVAARAARFALEHWFSATVPQRPPANDGDLHGALLDGLLQTGLEPSKKISGTMVRHLPTTLAAIEYRILGDRVELAARWAGDSRAYIIDQADGLQAVSRDDTQDSDALILLTNDQPMNNVVSADRPFQVNAFLGASPLRRPVMLACVTDGFYNYVATPAHFEHLLLHSLFTTGSLEQWVRLLADRVQEYTSDDASLVIAAVGYPTHAALRLAFQGRLNMLEHQYMKPFRLVSDSGQPPDIAPEKMRQWAQYRGGYEKWIRCMEGSR